MIRSFHRALKSAVLYTAYTAVRSLRTLLRSAASTTTLLFTAAALLACTPAYDWRTIQNNDDAYEVTFPAKPRSDARDIDVAGKPMHMKMQTAEAGDAVFAVGTVDLPDADPATQRAALDFLQQGLARNLNAAPAAHPVDIEVAAGGHLAGAEITVSGTSANGQKSETRQIRARFIAKGTHAYQVAIVSTKMPPPDQIDQFFSSFKLF
ncbi:hypothetical protein SBC1_02510 [Caballeronia sp. SBC1]|uniref:hypothetical protein n=1 Tax=Caballeronia sp. SBC1 TaxID=2705548 RepID=UPI00140F0174|nr:hypothetical protein [Caballeronia sp. SBC1]QIN60276.1 hypothetical protein SBC1_02510 [Caballeronia sp. SBC1]